MSLKTLETANRQEEELVATFGEARLVRIEGRLCLRGGAMADRTEALEWLAATMPEEVGQLQR